MSNQAKTNLSSYLLYSLPVITSVWLIAPLGVLQGIYAKYFGLSLSTIAVVILCARLFDAVSDPLVGYYADHYHRRSGTRKPMIVIGGLLFIVCGYFLYVPFGVDLSVLSDVDSPATASVSVVYFSVCFIAFYMTSTLFEIPHIAWAGELAEDAGNKAKIFSYRNIAGYLGSLSFFAIPLLPVFDTADITPVSLRLSVLIAGVFMLFFLIVCVTTVPNSLPPDHAQHKKTHPAESLQTCKRLEPRLPNSLLSDVVGNTPFLLFIASFLLTALGTGMWYGLLFIYVDAYLNLGAEFAPMFIYGYVAGIAATPIWCHLAIKLGKRTTWLIAMVLIITGFVYTGTLVPGTASLRDLLFLQMMIAIGFAAVGVIAPAMVSEISDYGAWKSKTERPASYFALYAFSYKTAMAVSSALGFAIAGWYGFDATTQTQSESGVFGMTLAVAWVPVVCSILALIFIASIPMTTHRHGIIRRRLDSRSERIRTEAESVLTTSQQRQSGTLVEANG